MKTLFTSLFALVFSFTVLANDEAVFSANVEQTDQLHTRIAFSNAKAAVQITVFNKEDGIVFSQTATTENFETELNYLDFNSGSYTIMIETQDQIITRNVTIDKQAIELQVTLISEEDGIVFKQITTAADYETAIPVDELESGEYLLVLENEGTVLADKNITVK